LELTLKILRTSALPALMSVVAKISHIVSLPTWVFSPSTALDNFKSSFMGVSGNWPHVEPWPLSAMLIG
jgi:hypothetical protein